MYHRVSLNFCIQDFAQASSQVAWLCLENCHAPLPIPLSAGFLHFVPAPSTFGVPVATESAAFSIRHAKIAKDESKGKNMKTQ